MSCSVAAWAIEIARPDKSIGVDAYEAHWHDHEEIARGAQRVPCHGLGFPIDIDPFPVNVQRGNGNAIQEVEPCERHKIHRHL